MQMTETRLNPLTPLPVAEKAWLTYQALSLSDDLVILLEGTAGAAAADDIILGVNEAFRRISGYTNDDLLGRPALDLFPSESNTAALRAAIRDGRAMRSEMPCRRSDGSIFMFGLHLMPAPAREPGRHCFVILGRDITAILKARQMQDSVQRLLAKVFTSVDEAIAIANTANEIVMTNPGYDRLLGYKPNAVVGRNALDVVAPESRAAVAAAAEAQWRHGNDITYCEWFLRADGSSIQVRVTSVIVTTDMKRFRVATIRPVEPPQSEAVGSDTTRSISAGRISMVGLDDVRAALGDRWRAVADRVIATAEAVLKRRCGPLDSYSRAGETSFLVCFGALNETEAGFRAAMISREIRNRLIGQGEAPDTAYVRSIAAALRVPQQEEGSPAAQNALLAGLDMSMDRVESEARQTLAAAWAAATSVIEAVHGRSPGQVVANRIRLPVKLRRSLMTALSVLPRKEAEAFDLDGLLLSLAAKQIIADMGNGVSFPLLVDVQFDVFLTRASTLRYFAVCEKIDPRVAGRLILMLTALPRGLPKSRLLDAVTRLRPFCTGVGYYADDLSQASAIDLSNSYNPIVAMPFAAVSGNTDKAKGVIYAMHAQRARVLVYRVDSDKDASLLRAIGTDMLAMAK